MDAAGVTLAVAFAASPSGANLDALRAIPIACLEAPVGRVAARRHVGAMSS
jgi:hypothetical protein